jgi:hypothetical protein
MASKTYRFGYISEIERSEMIENDGATIHVGDSAKDVSTAAFGRHLGMLRLLAFPDQVLHISVREIEYPVLEMVTTTAVSHILLQLGKCFII